MKVKCIQKAQNKSQNPQRSAAVRKFHANQRSVPTYNNLVHRNYFGFTVCASSLFVQSSVIENHQVFPTAFYCRKE